MGYCMERSRCHRIVIFVITLCFILAKGEPIQQQTDDKGTQRNSSLINADNENGFNIILDSIQRDISQKYKTSQKNAANTKSKTYISNTPLQEAIIFFEDLQNSMKDEELDSSLNKKEYYTAPNRLGSSRSAGGSNNKKMYFIIGGVLICILVIASILICYCCCCKKNKKKKKETPKGRIETIEDVEGPSSLRKQPQQKQPVDVIELNVQNLSQETPNPIPSNIEINDVFPSAPPEDRQLGEMKMALVPEIEVSEHYPTKLNTVDSSPQQEENYSHALYKNKNEPGYSNSLTREANHRYALSGSDKDFERNYPVTSSLRIESEPQRIKQNDHWRNESIPRSMEIDPRIMESNQTRLNMNPKHVKQGSRRFESDPRRPDIDARYLEYNPKSTEYNSEWIEADARRKELDSRIIRDKNYSAEINHDQAHKDPYPSKYGSYERRMVPGSANPRDNNYDPNYHRGYQEREYAPMPTYDRAPETSRTNSRYLDKTSASGGNRGFYQNYSYRRNSPNVGRRDPQRQNQEFFESTKTELHGPNDHNMGRRGSSEIKNDTSTIKNERYREPYSRDVRHELSSLIHTKNFIQKQDSNRISKSGNLVDSVTSEIPTPLTYTVPLNQGVKEYLEPQIQKKEQPISSSGNVPENKESISVTIPLPVPDYIDQSKDISSDDTSSEEETSPAKFEPVTPIKPREFKGPYGPEDLDDMNNPYTISRAKAKKLVLESDDDEY